MWQNPQRTPLFHQVQGQKRAHCHGNLARFYSHCYLCDSSLKILNNTEYAVHDHTHANFAISTMSKQTLFLEDDICDQSDWQSSQWIATHSRTNVSYIDWAQVICGTDAVDLYAMLAFKFWWIRAGFTVSFTIRPFLDHNVAIISTTDYSVWISFWQTPANTATQ